MACTQEYIDFVCQQVEGVGVVRTRKMFGDWCIYVDEKPVILAYLKKFSVYCSQVAHTMI
ncbi:MAG: transcriptional regulator [Bacteroidaceae bacterium]|nr:transcriptional regulator [Bacteroidaceae bacterium]